MTAKRPKHQVQRWKPLAWFDGYVAALPDSDKT